MSKPNLAKFFLTKKPQSGSTTIAKGETFGNEKMEEFESYLSKYFQKRNPKIDIQKFGILNEFQIPSDYSFYLENFEGEKEVFIGEQCFLLWNVENLLLNNLEYGIQDNLPSCFAIGTNLGGEFIGIDFENNSQIILCPFVAMDKNDFICIGKNFYDFFNRLEVGKDWFD